jgi:hypothetical protein
MKAFEDSGIADTPSYRTFQRRMSAVLVVLLAWFGWGLTTGTGFMRAVSGVGVALVLGLLVTMTVLLIRHRAKRRQESTRDPN